MSEIRGSSFISPHMDEIQLLKKRAAEILGIRIEQVAVYGKDAFRHSGLVYHMSHSRHAGMNDDNDYMPIGTKSHGWCYSFGFQQFRTDHKTPAEFLMYHNNIGPIQTGTVDYVFIKRGTFFRISRALRRAYIKHNAPQIHPAPVLADGILQLVMDNSINLYKGRKKFAEFGVKVKRGILLDGTPGNGKTMLCKHIKSLCAQNSINTETVTASQLEDAFGKNQLGAIFSKEGIIFFDDIDIAYLDRKHGNGKMACSLLGAMDGMEDTPNSIRIFTTNEKVNGLDPAFTRPGRIDVTITINKPTFEMRRQLVDSWPKSITSAINTSELLANTGDMSFAELEGVRSMLVLKHISTKAWNLAGAIEEINHRRAVKPSRMGLVG